MMHCPYCGQLTNETHLPPMSPSLRKFYKIVERVGSDGIDVSAIMAKLYDGKKRSETTVRTRLYRLNSLLREHKVGTRIVSRDHRYYVVKG